MSTGEGVTEPIDSGNGICEPVREAPSPTVTRTVEIVLKKGDVLIIVTDEPVEKFLQRVFGSEEEGDLEC